MTEASAEFLESCWQELIDGGDTTHTGWRSKNLPVRADGRLLALAVDENAQHHLLVPKGAGVLPTNAHSPLSVAVRDFQFGNAGGDEIEGSYLDIHCQIEMLNGQFDKVVLDVIEAVEGSRDPAGAAAAAVAAWRRLFAKLADVRALTYQQRVAVFGELSVLQSVVENGKDFQPEWWTGPYQEPHDFELSSASLEVKSIGDDSPAITVHGFEQLERTDDKPLHLVIRKVVESQTGKTVAEMLSEILAVAGGAAEIRERAAAVGVFETDPDLTRFEVVETLIGEVDGDFPRISFGDLNGAAQRAVTGISYDIDLTVLRASMTVASVSELVRTFND